MRFILSQDYCWCVIQRERKGLYVVVPLMRMETLGCFISNLVRRLGKSEAGMSCCVITPSRVLICLLKIIEHCM